MSYICHICDLPDHILHEIFGTGDPDASDGILYQAAEKNRIPVNTDQRTLIIGLGGQGIKTVNNIKKSVKTKFKNWEERIAFLAIDTDKGDLNRQTFLEESEKHFIESDTAANSFYCIPKNRSLFTESWINPFFSGNVSNQAAMADRQVCMAKLFYNHNDEKIIAAIREAARKVTTLFNPATMSLTVHIVAGISGCTGSGSIVHIAHFVRRALQVDKRICGYLLLPDVTDQFLQGSAGQKNLYVNGYATLKELDYFYSAIQRDGSDSFYLSDPDQGKKDFDYFHPLYDMLYLFNGTNGMASPNPNKAAIEALSDSILTLLSESPNANVGAADGQLISSFLANAAAARTAKLSSLYETDGSEKSTVDCGEDVFNYNALGVASATIPEHTIKCYSVTKIMRTVFGRVNGFEAPAEFHGFSSTAMTGVEADTEIKKLLAFSPVVVEKKIYDLCDAALRWPDDFEQLTRADILSGAEANLRIQLNIDQKKSKIIAALKDYLTKAYESYRDGLKTFLIKFGPMPYAKMFDGVDAAGVAYKNSMRAYLSDYKTFNTSKLTKIKPAVSAREKNEAYDKVKTPLFGHASGIIGAWHEAYRKNEVNKLAEEIAGAIFGEAGAYRTGYLDPIENASRRVIGFDFALNKLSKVYDDLGSRFDTYENYCTFSPLEKTTFVDLIRSEEDYQWAKDIIDTRAKSLSYETIKAAIIDSFMKEPEKWTDYDTCKPAITPRRMLDSIMAPYVDTGDVLTVVSYFRYKLASGSDPQMIVSEMVQRISSVAVPLYNADPNSAMVHSSGVTCLMVPKDMFLQEGGNTLCACFNTVCAQKHFSLITADTADKMVCLTLWNALPLYALKDLKKWESWYDASPRKMLHMNESGKGYFDPETGLAWEDYPALALVRNPRNPNWEGIISREGRFLKEKFDPLFNECLKEGIIEKKKDVNGGYYYICYLLDRPGWDLTLDVREYDQTDSNGLYLTGTPVFSYLAEKNGVTLTEITYPLALKLQDAFNAPTTNEQRALERAKRALRRNVPLFRSLKKTLVFLKKIDSVLTAANAEVQTDIAICQLPKFIASGVLRPDSKNCWSMNDYPTEGKRIDICYPDTLPPDKDAALIRAGFLYEYLCRAFAEKMKDDEHILTFYHEAWGIMTEEPEVFVPEFLKRLEPFKKESDAFIENIDNPALQMTNDPQALADMVRHYRGLLRLYKKLKAFQSES